jgi:hypothetical protein
MRLAALSRSSPASLMASMMNGGCSEFVDAVGGQDEQVAFFDLQGQIVDFELRADAQRAAEIALIRGNDQPMVVGQLLQVAVAEAINAAVADMEDMRGVGLDDQRAERAHITAVHVVAVLAVPALRIEPGVCCGQHALRRRLDRPGFRSAVVVVEKTLDRRFAGYVADLAAADAVGQGDGDSLATELRFVRDAQPVKILIDFLAALVGVLADGESEFAGHCA